MYLLTKKKISAQLEVLRSVCEDPDGNDVGDQIVSLLDSEGHGLEGVRGNARDMVFFALGYIEAACHALDITYNEIVDDYL